MRLKLYRGKWAAVGKDAEGRTWRRSLRTSDRAEAERRLRDARYETPADTIEDAMSLYLAEKRTQNARSYQSMLTAWRALKPVFGHLRPDQVNRDLCRSYASKRRRGGVSNGTIIKDLGVLKAGLRWNNKATPAVFEMPLAPLPRDRYITRQEHLRLIEACNLPHIKLFVVLAWDTAARASALLDLTWDQVDFIRRQIRLSKSTEGKRKGRATVPVEDDTMALLTAAYEARTCDFVIEWGGHQVKSVKRAFADACQRANLKDVSPHVIRHSAAVKMAESGVPINEIAQFLGHTDPAITYRVYARYSPEHLRRAARALR